MASKHDRRYLDQYDSGDPINTSELSVDESRLSKKQRSELFPLIGEIIVSFNNVESSLDYLIADAINMRSRQPGYTIAAEVPVFTKKINLYRALYGPSVEKSGMKEFHGLYASVVRQLFQIKDVRNDVVHANWDDALCTYEVKLRLATDEKGVYTQTKVMTPAFLREKIESLNALWGDMERFSWMSSKYIF